MDRNSQSRSPIHEALLAHRQNRVVPFDVPGHKGGRGNKELTDFLGLACMSYDTNSMKPLDNLCHPVSVIKEAQELAAQAFGADHAFFMVGGTTHSVQAMIMAAVGQGEEIILPRNVHRSAINALVLNGAKPIYIDPGVQQDLGIPLGMGIENVRSTIQKHPQAKAILVNNPTYYGICSDLKTIVEIAHAHGMLVLVDEAHGTHFYFGTHMPISAMAVGADMAAISMHKTGGSLTQSSILLCQNRVNPDYVRQIINLTQTTSASYLLLSSLDIARKNLSLHGAAMFAKTVSFANYSRCEINKIGGYLAFSKEICNQDSVFDFDLTKLSVNTREIGLAGIEVYDILRDEFGIQIEFGDIGNILAVLSAGDRDLEIERLIAALGEIKRLYQRSSKDILAYEYIPPIVAMLPQKAFFASKQKIPLSQSVGKICGEFVMSYPPGIPALAPGEVITKSILEYIIYAKAKGCLLTGTEDMTLEFINVVDSQEKFLD